jgi:DNA-binding IclR family transcriptional regulator
MPNPPRLKVPRLTVPRPAGNDTPSVPVPAAAGTARTPRALRMPEPAKRIRGTASSRKVLQVLTSFSPEQPVLTVDALAKRIKVPLSTAYRYVALLREVGLMTDDSQGGYHLSPRLVELARASRAAFSFIDVAQPVMETLRDASGETVILVRRVGDSAICVERVESAQRVRLSFEIGAAFPLHRGASPKILLAYMSQRERDDYLTRVRKVDNDLRRRPAPLSEELARIAEQAWAESSEEITPDIWAAAAPIFDNGRLVAALSVAGPAYRLPARARPRIIALTRKAAEQVSARLNTHATGIEG